MNLKNGLRDIETDCRDGFHDLAPPNRRGPNSTHIRGTHVPVEEPSTASKGDITTIRFKAPEAHFALRGRPHVPLDDAHRDVGAEWITDVGGGRIGRRSLERSEIPTAVTFQAPSAGRSCAGGPDLSLATANQRLSCMPHRPAKRRASINRHSRFPLVRLGR